MGEGKGEDGVGVGLEKEGKGEDGVGVGWTRKAREMGLEEGVVIVVDFKSSFTQLLRWTCKVVWFWAFCIVVVVVVVVVVIVLLFFWGFCDDCDDWVKREESMCGVWFA